MQMTGVAQEDSLGEAASPNQNAVAKLNSLGLDIKFELVEQSSNKLDPSFTMMVKCDRKCFTGFGGSKKTAKLVVAEKALKWLRKWTAEDQAISDEYFKQEDSRLEKRRAYIEELHEQRNPANKSELLGHLSGGYGA